MDSRPAEFHCGYATSGTEIAEKGRFLLEKYEKYINLPTVVELGCGEGAMLLALKRKGRKDILGVDSNLELLQIARSLEVPVVESDIWDFLRSRTLQPAVYFYIDVMEHVPLEQNLALLSLLPVGSRLILQTPYTDSILGHRSYMNVPSHVAPYSPWVIKKLFARFGYQLVTDGSCDWDHPPNWKNKIRSFILLKLMGISAELILGGGNFFAVADRIQDGHVQPAASAGT
jgi:SAM-dependent methyltransferase